MNRFFKTLLPVAAVLVMAGCAKEQSTSTGEQAREYLELFVKDKYGDIQPDQWGIYLLDQTPGTGKSWDPELPYSSVRYTIRSLKGTITSYTEADIAKQLDQDSYKDYNYYGPRWQNTAEGTGYAGLEYILQDMKVGGKKTVIIPSWLLTTSRYSTKQQYLDNCSSKSHMIYSITLEGQCKDVAEEEKSILRRYVTEHFGADIPSSTYKSGQAEGTFYFVSDTTAFKDVTQRTDDALLYLTYTGRRLDGVAFDTNSQDVALAEGLYNASATYSKASIQFSATYSSIQMNNSSSLIDAFQGALYRMHWAGQKATVLFVSELGYGTSGSGDAIPSYASLIFELELSETQ